MFDYNKLLFHIQVVSQFQNPRQQQPQNQQLIQQVTQLTQTINARKAVLIAEMTKDYMEEEQKIMGEYSGDPLIKLKAREVDLRAMENERKKEADQAKVENDRAKLMQAADIADEKLDQNEKLAKLRAGVSLAKTGVDQAKVMIDD